MLVSLKASFREWLTRPVLDIDVYQVGTTNLELIHNPTRKGIQGDHNGELPIDARRIQDAES
jgi:hypothetical protein